MITNKRAIEILKIAVNKFPIDFDKQEYREFCCANCYKKVRKAWHVHCHDLWFKRELHFCKSCYTKISKENNATRSTHRPDVKKKS